MHIKRNRFEVYFIPPAAARHKSACYERYFPTNYYILKTEVNIWACQG